MAVLSRIARRFFDLPGAYERDLFAVVGLGLAGALGLFVLVATLFDLRKLRQLERNIVTKQLGTEGATEHHDLGLGDSVLEVKRPGTNPYRDMGRLLGEVRGDIKRLTWALRWGGAGAVTMLTGLVVLVGFPTGTSLSCL